MSFNYSKLATLKPKFVEEMEREQREKEAQQREQSPPSPPADLPDLKIDLRSDLEIRDQQINEATVASEANCLPIPRQFASEANLAPEANPALAATKTKATIASILTVNDVPGELRIPNRIMDSLLPLLPPLEVAIYLRLFRLTHGYRKDTCVIGLNKLAASTNISRRSVQTLIESLEKKGLIERIGANLLGNIKGNIYRVYIPPTLAEIATGARIAPGANNAPKAMVATNKDLKNKLKKEYKKLIDQFRQIHIGKPYPISELAEDVKLACAREGKIFDPDVFNDLIK